MGNSRFKTTCREDSCKADIVMLKTTNGKWCPVDADTVDEDYEGPFDMAVGHVSHFKSCTKADQFSKNRQTQQERVAEQKVDVDPSRSTGYPQAA